MALFSCQECKNDISLSATMCPKCGSPNPFSIKEIVNSFWKCSDKIRKNLPDENIIVEALRTTVVSIVFSILVAIFAILLYGFILQSIFFGLELSDNLKYFYFYL